MLANILTAIGVFGVVAFAAFFVIKSGIKTPWPKRDESITLHEISEKRGRKK